MCAGMADHAIRQKIGAPPGYQSPTDPNAGEDVLTYTGSRKKNKENKCNRRDVNCRGFCVAETRSRGIPMECDEFPFASSFEGGGLASKKCIPATQNSGYQGRALSRFLQICGLGRNDKYLVRIEGGCGNVNRIRSEDGGGLSGRDVVSTPQTISNQNDTLFDARNQDDPTPYVAVLLDPLSVGRYDITVKFDGTPEDVAIVDNTGEEYASVKNPTGSSVTFSFDVEDDVYIPAVLYATTSKPIQVSYEGSIKPLEDSTQESPGDGDDAPKSRGAPAFSLLNPVVVMVVTVAVLVCFHV